MYYHGHFSPGTSLLSGKWGKMGLDQLSSIVSKVSHRRHLLPVQFSWVVQSCLTLQPYGLQHDRLHQLPELAQTHVHQVGDGHPTISTSVVPFSSCLQSFPASGSFPMSQFFTSGGQRIGASVSASVLPINIQDWFLLGLTGLVSLQSQTTLQCHLQHHSSKVSILQCSAFFIVQLSHSHMTTGKTISWTIWTFVGKVISLFFNLLSRLVITFLPKSKHLLISWLQSPSAVILEPPEHAKLCRYKLPHWHPLLPACLLSYVDFFPN